MLASTLSVLAERIVRAALDAVSCRLDALLTIQADHELLDVFMGAQRQMRHLMDENRALQEETVRLVRRTEVLVGECDDERRNRRKFVSFLQILCGAVIPPQLLVGCLTV